MNSSYFLGIDIGSVSLKCVLIDDRQQIIHEAYSRTEGQPLEKLRDMLSAFAQKYPRSRISAICTTGSGKDLVKNSFRAATENEIICHAKGTKTLHPDVCSIIEIGGQDSKLILFDPQAPSHSKRVAIEDFSMNELCAAGTGAFLDEQAYRLGIDIRDFASTALESESASHIAGRCAVFAKTDMVHLQQKGTPLSDILLGVAFSMARNYLSNLVRGRQLHPKISFQGGVASNQAIKHAFCQLLRLQDGEMLVPEHFTTMGAFGAALFAAEQKGVERGLSFLELMQRLPDEGAIDLNDTEDSFFPPLAFYPELSSQPNSSEGLPASFAPDEPSAETTQQETPSASPISGMYLGIDIGSVSEKLVATDTNGSVVYQDYRYSYGKVLPTLTALLKTFHISPFGERPVLGVGITGSGRYLAAKVIGADLVKNEISAQVAGTRHVMPACDTIIEIGGQDAKFIRLEGDVHLEFLMNKVCAAGTGSFLQEQAERLQVDLEQEFSSLAFCSQTPIKLGNKCTVFMESDLVHYTQKGYALEDILAGLSYAVAGNFIDRVAQNRPVGNEICFQGGVAANAAVKRAFEHLLQQPVQVPSQHKVTGALGVALLAKQARERGEYTQSGYHPKSLDSIRAERRFQCSSCPNQCFIQQFFLGNKTIYLGGSCGRYELGSQAENSEKKIARGAQGLTSLKLLAQIREAFEHNPISPQAHPAATLGVPRSLLFYEFYPLWNSFFTRAGLRVVPSRQSTRELVEQGMPYVTVDTCLPVKMYHGHVLDLLQQGIETIFVPGHVHTPSWESYDTSITHCPYIQSIPEFINTAFKARIIAPTAANNSSDDGYELMLTSVATQLLPKRSLLDEMLKPYFKEPRLSEHFQQAVRDFQAFKRTRYQLGKQFLKGRSRDEIVYVVFGKPYNLYDSELNMNLFQKMAVLEMEGLPVDAIDPQGAELSAPYSELQWYYNHRMLEAAMFVRNDARLFPIVLTNYGCGPDPFSFRHLREVFAGKPILVIEIDEHTADAGVVTRLEAFQDEVRHFRVKRKQTKRSTLFSESHVRKNSARKYDKVYIPHFAEHAHTFASVLRANGTEAEVLPPPNEEVRDLGRRHAVGGECQPFLNLMADYLYLLESGSFEKNSAFFMFVNGGCKMVQYAQNTIYEGKRYLPNTLPVIGSFNELFGENVSLPQKVRIFDNLFIGWVALDRILQKLHESRPYEVEAGTSDFAFKIARKHLCRGIERGEQIRGIEYALSVFEGLEIDRSASKKFVTISGDYYTRINAFANNDLFRHIERLGGVIFVPPTLADIIPIYMAQKIERYRKRADYGKLVQFLLLNLELRYQEQKVQNIFERDILNNFDMKPKDVLEKTSKYLNKDLSSGVISPVGSVIDTLEHGAKGIINVITLNCCFGNVITSVLQRVRRDYGDVPLLTLICEEQQGGNQLTRLEAFMHQVPEHPWQERA